MQFDRLTVMFLGCAHSFLMLLNVDFNLDFFFFLKIENMRNNSFLYVFSLCGTNYLVTNLY